MFAIFDLDDTLIRGDRSLLFTAFLQERGLNPDPDAVLAAHASASGWSIIERPQPT